MIIQLNQSTLVSKMENDFWVIIPAYNEEKNIVKVIEKVKEYTKNIVVVDDGSRDDTYLASRKTGVIVLKHIINY